MTLLDPKNIIWRITKSAPGIYIFALILYQMFNPNLHGLYIFLLMMLIGRTNSILKYLVFEPLYKLSGKNELPIIGIGDRPQGAKNCSFTIKKFDKFARGKNYKSFGMPSGHSQIAWTLTAFIIFQLFDKGNLKTVADKETNHEITLNNVKNVLQKYAFRFRYEISVILITYSILVSFSRVYVENCHTLQQVIIGMLFGVLFAYIAYYITHKYIY